MAERGDNQVTWVASGLQGRCQTCSQKCILRENTVRMWHFPVWTHCFFVLFCFIFILSLSRVVVPSTRVRVCTGICTITWMVTVCQFKTWHQYWLLDCMCQKKKKKLAISAAILLSKYSPSLGLRLSHLHFKCRQSEIGQFSSDILPQPNFHPLIWDMLWKPPHSLPGWHVFHAGDGQFRPLPPRVGHCLDTRRVLVWRCTAECFFFFCVCQMQPLQTIGAINVNPIAERVWRDISAVTSDRRPCKTLVGERSEPELSHVISPVTHRWCYCCHWWHSTGLRFHCKTQTATSCLALLC